APGSAMQVEEAEAIGLPLTADASCKVQGFSPAFAVDGDIETYWEGQGEYPQTLTLMLTEKLAVAEMTLFLNPIEVWGRRTQNFAVETSADGETFTRLLADKEYVFDWAEGNTVTIALPGHPEVMAVRLSFSGNSGAGGGQIAEAVLMPLASEE
ncbi:MAG: discoidin domain-containing protein, partial [Clostridia bacterium]|nr:discoidin domain-containing protein [Clostridia bacterium]